MSHENRLVWSMIHIYFIRVAIGWLYYLMVVCVIISKTQTMTKVPHSILTLKRLKKRCYMTTHKVNIVWIRCDKATLFFNTKYLLNQLIRINFQFFIEFFFSIGNRDERSNISIWICNGVFAGEGERLDRYCVFTAENCQSHLPRHFNYNFIDCGHHLFRYPNVKVI